MECPPLDLDDEESIFSLGAFGILIVSCVFDDSCIVFVLCNAIGTFLDAAVAAIWGDVGSGGVSYTWLFF